MDGLVTSMDAFLRSQDRRRRWGMKKFKPSLSPTLTEVNQHYDDEDARIAAGLDKAFATLRGYPYGYCGPVFIWLWRSTQGLRTPGSGTG